MNPCRLSHMLPFPTGQVLAEQYHVTEPDETAPSCCLSYSSHTHTLRAVRMCTLIGELPGSKYDTSKSLQPVKEQNWEPPSGTKGAESQGCPPGRRHRGLQSPPGPGLRPGPDPWTLGLTSSRREKLILVIEAVSAVTPGILTMWRGRLLSRSQQKRLVRWRSTLFSVGRPQLRRPAEGMGGKPGCCDPAGTQPCIVSAHA